MRNIDTIVIGSGLAGAVAALTAKTPLKKVLLLTEGYGAYYNGPGVIDLLGSGGHGVEKLVVNPWQEFRKLDREHPYSRLGPDKVDLALDKFKELVKPAGYSLIVKEMKNMLLTTAIGSIRPTYLAPTALANGDLSQCGDILLVGIKNFHYFYPGLARQNLTASLEKLGLGTKINECTIELGFNANRPVSGYDLALWLEQPRNLKVLVDNIKPRLGQEERVGLPAVLGVEKHLQILAKLERELGKKVFEIPTLPPCIPGIRLYKLISGLLRDNGVEVISGFPVTIVNTQNKVINNIGIDSLGKVGVFQAERYILATGGLSGGGLVSGPGWVREVIFNLPVAYVPEVDKWSRENLLEPKGQPYAYFGLTVDEKMHPLDKQGNPCFANLYAAGRILANFDPLAEKSGAGVDIATGYSAGIECSKVG